jgi:VWFA-related protein
MTTRQTVAGLFVPVLLISAALLRAAALPAAAAIDQQQPPPFRSWVDLVTVDVHVVDADGNPAGGLQPDDFTVSVDGKPRRTAAADLIRYGVGPRVSQANAPVAAQQADAGNAARPAPTPRTILLVVDEGNIRAGAARFAADAARPFLASLDPADRVGLITIPETSTHVEVTTDRAVVSSALDRIVGHRTSVETQIGQEYPVGLSEAFSLVHDTRQWNTVLWRECVERVPRVTEPPPECVAELEHIARSIMSDARQRMIASARSLSTVVEALAQVQGPKILVLLSEELPVADYLAERLDFRAETARISAAAAKAQASVYVLQLHSPLFDVENRTQLPTATADADARSFGLETVATLTGGRRLMVSGRAETAFQRVVRETSAYYLIAFEAGPGDHDGKLHTVTVTVKRKGLDVRARRQFSFAEATRPAVVEATSSEAPTSTKTGGVPATAVPLPSAVPPAPVSSSDSTPPPSVVAGPPDLPAVSAPASPAAARSLEDLLARAVQYVVAYGETMSLVIGVERYAQWMQNTDYVRPVVRNLVSEFALVRIKDDWLGFRNVVDLDGKPVGDRQDRLQKLFLDSPATAMQASRAIADESARYNMGPLQRNFNVPTTALFFLHPSNRARFAFKKDGEETLEGARVWKIRYRETLKPTIIRTSRGKDMPVKGLFWIDPADGRVLKTNMELESEAMLSGSNTQMRNNTFEEPFQGRIVPGWNERRVLSSVSITVSYGPEPRLGLLVPREMLETYEGPFRSQFTGNESASKVNCRATYSDFKRFETSGRVIVK